MPLSETYNWKRASDALKITRLALSTGPFWGGPNTRAQHHISALSSCLGISCSRKAAARRQQQRRKQGAFFSRPPFQNGYWVSGWVRTGGSLVGKRKSCLSLSLSRFFLEGREGGREVGDWHKARHCCVCMFFLFGQTGKKMDQGDCPTYSIRQFPAPTPPKRIILLNLGCVQHQVITYYLGGGGAGGGWTVKFNFACRRDLLQAARQTHQTVGAYYVKRSPYGLWDANTCPVHR